MKVLFIANQYLHDLGGGANASRAYVNAFAEIFDDVTLLYPMREGYAPIGINEKVKGIPVWDKRSKIRKFLDFLIGRQSRYYQLKKIVGDKKYDLVVHSGSMSVKGRDVDYFKRTGAYVITIHHNYDYEYFRDNTSFPLLLPQLFWVARIEKEAVRKSDLNLTLTEQDKKLLTMHYGTGCEKFDLLGVFEYCRREIPSFDDIKEPIFLITGSLSAMQTENSLIPWIDNYYPIIREIFPNATLTLAGKSPSSKLIAKAHEQSIEVIASPETMYPVLKKAKFYICPTSLGGGLKLRVMDGLSAGLPVVCHKVSARGYEIFEKYGVLLVYNDIKSFRLQLQKLNNLSLNRGAVIELYNKEFSFESGKRRLLEIMKRHNVK